MQFDLYIPGPPGPTSIHLSVDLPDAPTRGDYLTITEAPYCVRVSHVPADLDDGIEVQLVS